MATERLDEPGRPRLRIDDDHGHRAILQPSLLRPGSMAIVTPPGQRVVFLSHEDVLVLAQYIADYLNPQED